MRGAYLCLFCAVWSRCRGGRRGVGLGRRVRRGRVSRRVYIYVLSRGVRPPRSGEPGSEIAIGRQIGTTRAGVCRAEVGEPRCRGSLESRASAPIVVEIVAERDVRRDTPRYRLPIRRLAGYGLARSCAAGAPPPPRGGPTCTVPRLPRTPTRHAPATVPRVRCKRCNTFSYV